MHVANKKKIIPISILVAIALLMVICLVTEVTSHPLRHWLDDVIYDNYNHYLPCRDLPTYDEVQKVIATHQDTLDEILQINPGLIGWEVDPTQCPGKADLLFWYGGHAERVKIEAIINSGTFFGVPYRLRNQ